MNCASRLIAPAAARIANVADPHQLRPEVRTIPPSGVMVVVAPRLGTSRPNRESLSGLPVVPLAPVVRVVPLVTAVWFRPAVAAVAKFLAVMAEENRTAIRFPVTSATTRISSTIGTTLSLSKTATSASSGISGACLTTVKLEP